MTDTLQIGPFALPVLLLVMIAAVALGAAAGHQLARKSGIGVDSAFFRILFIGAIAARLVHVWQFKSAYLAYPLSLLDVSDGGWDFAFGFAVAWVYALAKTRSGPTQASGTQRKPIIAALATTTGIWLLGALLPAFVPVDGIKLAAVPLSTLEGGSAALSDQQGRPTVVNLWATWCPSCQHEMPVLQQAQADHPEVSFVFVDEGESADQVRIYLANHHVTLRNVLLDSSQQLARYFHEEALPTTLFFDAQGHLASTRIGALTPSLLMQRLDALGVMPEH